MFFDANTSKWAPAKDHEIFRTLFRESQGRDHGGFVAPPPPTMMRQAEGTSRDEAGEAEDEPAEADEVPEVEEEPVVPDELLEVEESPGEAEGEPVAADEVPEAEEWPVAAEEGPAWEGHEVGEPLELEEPLEVDELDLVEDEPTPAAAPHSGFPGEEPPGDEELSEEHVGDASRQADEADDFDFGLGDFGALDLDGPADDGAWEEAELGRGGGDEAEGDEEEASYSYFDFGEGDLEMEPAEGEPAEEDPVEVEASREPVGEGGVAGPEEEEPAVGDTVGEGLEIEDAAAAAYAPAPPEEGEEEAAAEAGRPAPGGGERRADGGGEDDDIKEWERIRRGARRPPRARPARVRGRKRGLGGVVGLVIAAGVLAGGAWFAWSYLSSAEEAAAPVEPQVEIPEIPAYLEPSLDEAAGPAYAGMVDSLRTLAEGLPESPTEEWLSGGYLANASRFPEVEGYWEELRAFRERVQEDDQAIFMQELGERLDSLEIVGEDRTALVQRARAGFQAARPDRQAIYGQLDELIRASLELHDFLVSNEESIDYEPSVGGISRDPITEAVPATEALGEAMWDQVAEITTALDNLGALDRVTTERLVGIVLDKLSRTSIR